MSDMLRMFVNQALDQQLHEKYPHMQNPAGVYARIVRAQQVNETYMYTIRILDEALNADENFPEVPCVRSDIEMKPGDVAVVLLLYGGRDVYVIGRRES